MPMSLFSFFGGRPYIADCSAVGENQPFDYIIIGGGTAGCVLASRLSENPQVRVLLLEAGGSGVQLAATRWPSCFSSLFRTPEYDWNLYTVPQLFAANKVSYWPRGKMLGGCSSVNAMMAQYGDPSDFDAWAQVIGDDTWAWNNFRRYFTKFEKYLPKAPSDVDISLKGSDGPVKIGYFSRLSKPAVAFIKSCMNLKIPFISDFNGATGSVGVNQILSYIDENRVRVSAESAYLTRAVLARPNLKVAIHAHVTKVIVDQSGSTHRATGVEFSSGPNQLTFSARATKEVILSAGAIHSPHILLLSGIGPRAMLQQHNVPIVHILPGVGSNLVDHPMIRTFFKDKTNSAPVILNYPTILGKIRLFIAKIQYFLFKSGPLTSNWGESAAFFRSDSLTLFPEDEKVDMNTVNSTCPDLEIVLSGMAFPDPRTWSGGIHAVGLYNVLLRPLSKGTIGLKSANPWDAPLIDPRYLESQHDADKLVRAARLATKIARTEPLASLLDVNYVHPALDGNLHLKTDAELEQHVRQRVDTLFHPMSSCRMAPLEDEGVVDSQLRVYGIQGLRVCDASIFPSTVSGHTTGATYAVAEKLSELLQHV